MVAWNALGQFITSAIVHQRQRVREPDTVLTAHYIRS